MAILTKLGEWRKGKGWTQGDLADKIEEPRPTYQKWESGVSLGIPPEIQAKLRKAGYTGPWPQEEAKEKARPQAGDYITREEFAELRGAVKAHILITLATAEGS